MPAGRDQAAEDGLLRRRLIDVEGLRIVLSGEVDDFFLADVTRTTLKHLADLEILEVIFDHPIPIAPRGGLAPQEICTWIPLPFPWDFARFAATASNG